MSKATKLNEGVVTSLADTDLVVAADNGGSLKPISMTNLMQLIRDNIKIGGRNLLKNTDIQNSNNTYVVAVYYYGADCPAVGESVLITIWGQLGEGKSAFTVFNGSGDGTLGVVTLKKIKDGVYQGTLNYLKESPEKRITVYATPKEVTSVSSIERIKLERGNIPTDWTPAPEDLSGGVMRRYSIGYGCMPSTRQKGGQRNEQGDKNYRTAIQSTCGSDRAFRKQYDVAVFNCSAGVKYGSEFILPKKDCKNVGNHRIWCLPIWRRVRPSATRRQLRKLGTHSELSDKCRQVPVNVSIFRRNVLSVQQWNSKKGSIRVACRKEVVAA